jgi:serine phosphatase RsbU (regulator of sigma subunit)
LVGADGSSRELKSSGAILGQFPNWHYAQGSISLNYQDTLLLFTDGVVEACDEQGEPFGEQRLLNLTRELANTSAAVLQAALLKEVSEHCRGQLADDVTMIVLRTPGHK